MIKKILSRISTNLFVVALFVFACVFLVSIYLNEKRMLEQVIQRLSADSRVAEVLVTGLKIDPETKQKRTTIKFLEYSADNKPLPPKYFTFSGDIIQFQSMVIRFDDLYVKKGHPLKGKSAYLFMRAFSLKDNGAEVFDITKINEVPSGYVVTSPKNLFEKMLWQRFWKYALDMDQAKLAGVKNAQIEAPGSRFVPGMLYTIKIEHDGGLRIDSQPLSPILKGENII